MLAGGLAGQIRRNTVNTGPRLTEREQEVLRLTADGLSGPEIGRELHLSPATVKTHLQHVYEKLGVSDRAAAVAEAMRRKLHRLADQVRVRERVGASASRGRAREAATGRSPGSAPRIESSGGVALPTLRGSVSCS